MSPSRNQTSDDAAASTAEANVSNPTTASATQNQPADAQAQPAQRRRHHIRRRERISQEQFLMMTAEAAARRQNAQGGTTTAAAPGSSASTNTNPVNRSSVAGMPMPYDPFTDEYWYNVHNQALRAEQASLQRRRTVDERVNEARGAYNGLTNILHRLRSNNNSPEPK